MAEDVETAATRRKKFREEAAAGGVATATPPPPLRAVSDEEARAALHQVLNESALDLAVREKARELLVVPKAPPIDVGSTMIPCLHVEQGNTVLRDKWGVVVIGAGGVGARLVPLIVKHLTNGDLLHVIDGDHVESKNLMRQHFTPADIGQPKAQVVAQRARVTAPRDGINISFTPMFLTEENVENVSSAIFQPSGTAAHELFGPKELRPDVRSWIVITCLDTLAARRLVRSMMTRGNANFVSDCHNVIWIDAGNAQASGQAMICGLFSQYRYAVQTPGAPDWTVLPGAMTGGNYAGSYYLETANFVLPGFLDRVDEEAPVGVDACAIRIDPQSVLANMGAAMAAASLTIPLLSLAGIRIAGISFSTSGTSFTAPISERIRKGGPNWRFVSKRLA